MTHSRVFGNKHNPLLRSPMVGGQEPIRKEVARMNDIYSTIDKLTADLIEAVYPAEDEGEISPVSLKCEIVKGDVTYYVTTKRDSKGIYEIDIKADTEDEAILKEKRAIIQALDVCLSNPRTIKDIQDGEITVIEAAREVLQVYDVLPQAVEEVNEIMSAKKRIVEAVEAAAADTANADNCIADYHFSVEAADEDGKNIKKLSIVFEN